MCTFLIRLQSYSSDAFPLLLNLASYLVTYYLRDAPPSDAFPFLVNLVSSMVTYLLRHAPPFDVTYTSPTLA